jgi:PST family polysaccharide transporter
MRTAIVKGGVSLAVRQVLSLPVNAVAFALVSRILQPSDFGIQAIVTPTVVLTLVLVDLGTSQALVQSAVAPSAALMRRVQWLKGVSVCLTTAGLFWLSSGLNQRLGLPAAFMLLLPACGVLGWLQSQRNHQAVGLQRRVEWSTIARIEMLEIVCYNLVLVALAFWLRSAWCFVVALGVRAGVGSLLLRIGTPRPDPPVATDSAAPLGRLLRFGMPLQATTLFGIANSAANPAIVGTLVGLPAVGLVNWSAYMVSLPVLPLQPLPPFLFSVLSERNRQQRQDHDLLRGVTFIGLSLVSLLSLMVVLSLDWVVSLVGPQWAGAVPLVTIMTVANIVAFPVIVLVSHLTSKGHSTTCLVGNVISTTLLWAVAWSAAGRWGARSYAMAWAAAWCVQLLFFSAAARKLTGYLNRWTDSLYLLVAFCCALGAVRWLAFGGQSVLTRSLLATVAGSAVYLAIVLPLAFARREECFGVYRLLRPGGRQ